jgi:hypothetical protein
MWLKLRKLSRDLFAELLGSHDECALCREHLPHALGGRSEQGPIVWPEGKELLRAGAA